MLYQRIKGDLDKRTFDEYILICIKGRERVTYWQVSQGNAARFAM